MNQYTEQPAAQPIIGITCMRRDTELMGSQMETFFLDRAYTRRIREAGGIPVILPQLRPQEAPSVVTHLDGLILSGGDDVHPNAYGAEDEGVSIDTDLDTDIGEITLLKSAVTAGLPVLGICRGAQIVNAAFGGSLHQEMLGESSIHPLRPENLEQLLARRHPVEVEPDSELARIFGNTQRETNSTHHQSIDKLAEGFRVSARAPDGVVEAIELEGDGYIVAVQWHPEKLPPPQDQELFDDLVLTATNLLTKGATQWQTSA